MKIKTKIIAILAVVTIAAAQTSITYVNPGSSPDATDGDTIRNAFIKCNNDFTYIGGQLSGLNSSLSGLATTYDPFGMATLIGLNATNYVRYAVGTNTVGWLGCLNAESNVLQSDITALTNNVNSLWTTLGGSSVLHSGGVMAFDQDLAWPHAMQIVSDGNGNLTADGSFHSSYLSDSYNSTPSPGMVATSQGTDGTWQWVTPPAFPTTMDFDADNITSDGSGNIYALGVRPLSIMDGSDGTGGAGCFIQANGSGGWGWTSWPTTLSYDSGAIYSDGSGDLYAAILKAELWDNGYSTGSSGHIPTANGDGTWTWTAWPTTLNYDSGSVRSDGSGDVTAVSIQAQLWDSTSSSGGGGQIPTAQGDGTWLWQTPAAAMVVGGGSGNVVYGGPMMFDFDGTTTNITSDGTGGVGLNRITVTNQETVILPDDDGDPPSSYGVQWRNQNGDTLFEAHAYNNWGVNVFNCMDYFGTGEPWAAMFSWSLIGRNDNARRCYLNVYGNAGSVNHTTIWDYEPDNGYDLLVHYNGVLQVDTSFNSDANQIYSDGSGNLTAQTFNPVSDRARKEKIVALSPANALAMALALNDYSWRFKARTNTTVSVALTNRMSLVTNVVVHPASGTEFGPMAQDWHAVTGLGGGTNISMTSMSGLLLGAIQGLAQAQGIFTNAAGARFALVVNAQTNGFIFVPQ